MPHGTNTVFYVPNYSVPTEHKVAYARMVVTICPQKNEVNRICVTIGGDILEYPGATTTNCASLTNMKCFLNWICANFSKFSIPGSTCRSWARRRQCWCREAF